MAVDAYIQAAASHLQNAAVALKQEAEQIRADFMNYEHRVTSDISTKDAERRMFMVRSGSAPDAETAAHFAEEARRLKSEIDQLKKELEQKRGEMAQAVKGKEGQMDGLMNEAKSLYSKASSMR